MLYLFALAVALTLSCSSDGGNSDNDSSSSSSSESNGNKYEYDYCVYMEQKICLSGPFESCANGGTPSNTCPTGYDTGTDTSSNSGNSSSSSEDISSSSGGGEACTAANNTSTQYCSNGAMKTYGSTPAIDGKTYKTVQIGYQIWMAENLNYAVAGSKCYGEGSSSFTSAEVQANCAKYGRLYNWATAMAFPASCNTSTCPSLVQARGICPSGWHIPSANDWDILMSYVQTNNGSTYTSGRGASIAGKHLKSTSDWIDRCDEYNISTWECEAFGNGNGKDTYGFAALPGGYGGSGSGFRDAGIIGGWWSSSEDTANYAYNRSMVYSNEDAYWDNITKTFLLGVRCLQD